MASVVSFKNVASTTYHVVGVTIPDTYDYNGHPRSWFTRSSVLPTSTATTTAAAYRGTKRCGRLERGEDCSFDEQTFYIVLLVVFLVTTLMFIWQSCSVKKNESTRRSVVLTGPQLSLLLAAASCFCVFLDSFVMLSDLKHGVDNDHRFSFFGSIFLLISLFIFAQRWCDVVRELEKRRGTREGQHGDGRVISNPLKCATCIIQCGYGLLAIMHIPFAVMRVGQLPSHEIALTLFVKFIIVENVALSLLAIYMCIIAFRMRKTSVAEGKTKDHINQLCWVTLLNLVEQVLYNGAMIAIHRLYFSNGYTAKGSVQAAYFSLWFAVYWLMHIQVLIFFRFVTFSDEGKDVLLGNDYEGQIQLDLDKEMAAGSPAMPNMETDLGEAQQQQSSPAPKGGLSSLMEWSLSPDDVNIEPLEPEKARNENGVRSTMMGSPDLEIATPLPDVYNPLASV